LASIVSHSSVQSLGSRGPAHRFHRVAARAPIIPLQPTANLPPPIPREFFLIIILDYHLTQLTFSTPSSSSLLLLPLLFLSPR
jgi:hypothetical protein